MAEKAYITDQFGKRISTEPIMASDITSSMLETYQFSCCGESLYGSHKGEACNTKMIFISASPQAPCHFREAPGFRHISGCKYDQTTKNRIDRVAHLDQEGHGLTPEEMFERFRTERSSTVRANSTAPVSPNQRFDHGNDTMKRSVTIERVKKKASNMRNLLDILQTKELDEYFGQLPVNDWIIDGRNIDTYRDNSIESGKPLIVICAKTSNIPNYIPRKHGSIVVVDAYAFRDKKEPMYFVIPDSSPSFRNTFFKREKKVFAISGEWTPVEGCKHVYSTSRLGKGSILALNEDDFI